MFGVLLNLNALVWTRHFCIHMQAMLSQGTLLVFLTKDYGHLLRRDINTDFHPVLMEKELVARPMYRSLYHFIVLILIIHVLNYDMIRDKKITISFRK